MVNKNIKEIHHNSFLGKSDYIPLAVKVAAPNLSDFTNFDSMKNPEIAITKFKDTNSLSMQVKSDWIPIIESNFLESLIPTLFGAEVYESAGGLVDVRAFIEDIEATENIEVTDIINGQMEDALNHLRYLKEHQIEGVEVLMSRFATPLDYAVIMRGGDFYLDLLTEPELAKNFMDKIADVTIKVAKFFKDELKEPYGQQVTIRGFSFPGIRLTGDAIVNLSPDMIREYMFPVYNKFAKEFNNVMLHYCTLPAPAGHVLPVLNECEGILCVDNWQGYKTFFDKNETGIFQEKTALCTDLTVDDIKNLDKFMNDNPFYSKVKRNGGRGLVASVTAFTVEEGKEIYEIWKNHFSK